jgi:hypothetical protein
MQFGVISEERTNCQRILKEPVLTNMMFPQTFTDIFYVYNAEAQKFQSPRHPGN